MTISRRSTHGSHVEGDLSIAVSSIGNENIQTLKNKIQDIGRITIIFSVSVN